MFSKATFIIVIFFVVFLSQPLWADELHDAAQIGDYTKVRDILKSSPNLINVKDKHGNTPIVYAAWRGHTNIVTFLLSKGAKIDEANSQMWTPLHRAAYNGHLGAVQALVNSGANINAKTSSGMTPLKMAEGNNHTEVAEFLKSRGAQR